MRNSGGHGVLNWVRQRRYCEFSGDTPEIINNRVQSGIWLNGVHVRVPEGSKERWVNLRAVENWAAGNGPAHTHGRVQ